MTLLCHLVVQIYKKNQYKQHYMTVYQYIKSIHKQKSNLIIYK